MTELESYYEAIAALSSPDMQISSAAAKWLEEFEKTVAAWSVSDRILGEARSFEACVFASQTIKRKILSNFRELPSASYDQLRDSLVCQLQSLEQKLGRNAPTVITQLAAALADLYLQVPAWGGDFLGDLLGRLTRGRSMSEMAGAVLTLLKVFPEELQSRHLRVGKNRRCVVEKALAEKTDTVVTLLGQIASTSTTADMEQQVKVISSLASWMLNRQCPTDSIAKSPLMLSILHALSASNCDMEVHDAATECVVNALYLVENVKTHRQLASVLQSGIYATLSAFKAAIVEEDQERIQNYARIYCELCESLLPEIVSQPGSGGFGDLRSIDMLLLVNDYHDYSIVETSFNMWYRLSEYLYQLDGDEFDELRPTFQPYVKRLIQSLCRHCCLDGDMESVLGAKTEISDFRRKAAETIKDVTFIVGSDQLLKEMIELLKSYASEGWEKMESTLFVISCFIRNINETEDVVIPNILDSIFSLPPSTHSMLLSTSAGLLGNLEDWLDNHPHYLVLATQWLISLAGNPSLLRTLAESLESLCEKGYRRLYAYFEPLLQMSQRVESGPIRGQEAEEASLCLLRAATHLLNDLPTAELTHRLEQLCLPRLQYLERISSLHPSVSAAGAPDADKENATAAFTNDVHLVLCIDGLAVIFRVLKPWQSQCAFAQLSAQLEAHPASAGHSPPVAWMALVVRIWRSIATVLDDYKANARVVEHICRAIRFIVRSMGNQSVHFIEQLVALLIQIYNEYPHSCFLYLASILTDENGSIAELQPGLVHMLKVLAERSFALIRGKDDLKNHPETVDDLFRLAIRFVQRAPLVFFREPISASLFQAAIMALELEHTDANRSVTKFLGEVIDIAAGRRGETSTAVANKESSAGAAEKLVVAHGEQLTWQCINAAVFHLPNMQRREVADLVYALKQLDEQKLSAWLGASVRNLPRDSGLAPTSQQLSEFVDELISADKSYVVANAIRDLAKHYS